MRQLSIPKDAPLHLMAMDVDNLVLHKVYNPRMWVFTKEFGSIFEWPKKLEHNGQTYEFVANEVMPHIVSGHFGGYAQYEIKNYVQRQVTHREFGLFVAALGNKMMGHHCSLNAALASIEEDGSDDITIFVANSLERDPIRARWVIQTAMKVMKAIDFPTVENNQPE